MDLIANSYSFSASLGRNDHLHVLIVVFASFQVIFGCHIFSFGSSICCQLSIVCRALVYPNSDSNIIPAMTARPWVVCFATLKSLPFYFFFYTDCFSIMVFLRDKCGGFAF